MNKKGKKMKLTRPSYSSPFMSNNIMLNFVVLFLSGL
jgi:hypothetical protein